jgi:KaiC/GvpD/RAD55 family RecA-like ATPase
MTLDERRVFRTGIEVLDRKLGGGIPMGTVTALLASPVSQSELFLYEMATRRQTVYLSTIRTAESITETLENREVDTQRVEAIRIDADDPLEHTQSVLSDIPDAVTVIIDPVDVLETAGGSRYRRFLSELRQGASRTSTTVILHCLREEPTPDRRRDTMHVADLVFELATEVRGDSIVNRLTVPKFRDGQSVEDVIKLDLTTEVEVDTSRNIL